MIVLKHGIVGRTLSVLLAVSLGLFLWPSYPTTANAVQLETLASGYDIDINSPDTFGWIPAEPHIDPPGDASGGATTKDIVGDAEHPSVFLQYSPDGTQLAIRMRVDAKDGGTEENPQFKNFMYFALDVNGSAAIDFMLGAYRPTEANGRLAIYLADPSKPNTGPGNTGATSPIASFQPIRGTNYSFIQAAYDPGDPLYPGFNGTPDYFITLVFSLEDIDNALAAVNKQNLQITPHSPFSYVIGTATQENSMNGDINGLVGVNSNDPWDFPAAISTDGEDYYTVHFNKNGGDRDASPLYASVKEGDRLRTPPTPPRKIGGWEFVGWSYDPNDDPENLQHEFLFEREAITGHLTIYAIWLARSTEEQLEEDTLHFDASGGNWVTAAKFQHRETEDGVIKDMPPTPLAPTTPAVQGGNSMRTFGGWVTSSTYGTNGNNILPISGNTNAGEIEFYIWSEVVKSLNKVYQSTCGEEEYTVYALWLDVPKSATSIHFYGNIPQPSLPTGRLLYDVYLGNNSTPSYTPTPPTRQGYDFKGWDTLPTGTGARYLNPYNTTTINNFLGAKFVDGQNLYAIWEPVRYAVVFDPNSIDTNGDKLSGRAQLEFYSALCVSNATSFLYPVFPDGPYDPNNIEPYPYGAEGPVRPNGPSLKHYAFRGWNTDPGGFGFWAYPNNSPEHTISAGGDMKFALLQQPYLPGSVVVDGKSVSGYTRLYAIWERQPVASVQINFVANPGRFVDGSATGEFGAWTTEEGKIESAEYSTPEYLDWDNPEGAYTHQYIFKGWSYLPGEPGDGRQVDFFHPLTEVFFTSCSVYAVWEEVPPDYTVTFWPNNGYWPSNEPDPYGPLTVGTDDYNLVLYVPYSNTPIHPVRPDPWPGFELLGWNTEFDGSGDVFRPSHAVTGNLNVYAQWKSLDPDVVSVLYYLNDGSGAPYSNYDYPDTMVKGSRLTAPLRALVKDEPGWTFGGWFTDENCSNQWIATTNTFDDDPTVLYAKWFVDVTFDDNYPDSLGTRVKSTQWDRTV
ncbi:MAG: InlB B-repeat-containing protein, partial [Coriobacteriales bacterium]|nr:InlB B-repeat-containing protein [Coriobacteriales bacterium]